MPAGISSRVLQCEEDIQEREGYIAVLEMENFENNLHHTVSNTRIGDSDLLSGYLYTNTDDTQKHPTMKLVSVITNHKRKSNNEDANIPIFIYKNSGRVVLLNDWENLEYFTVFFLSPFPFGIGGHVSIICDSKEGNISLELCGK